MGFVHLVHSSTLCKGSAFKTVTASHSFFQKMWYHEIVFNVLLFLDQLESLFLF